MSAKASVKSRYGVARRRGAGLVIALVTLLVITLLTTAVVQSLVMRLRQSRLSAGELQVEWLADAAVGRAAAQLKLNAGYDGEIWRAATAAPGDVEHAGVADIRVMRSGNADVRVSIEARYPDDPTRRVLARRSIEIPNLPLDSRAGVVPQETAP